MENKEGFPNYKTGQIVVHRLTQDRVMVLDKKLHADDEYIVRLPNYGEIVVNGFELEEWA